MSTIEFETIGSRLQSLEAALQAQNESHDQIVLSNSRGSSSSASVVAANSRHAPPTAASSASASALVTSPPGGISIVHRPAPPVPQTAPASSAAAASSSAFSVASGSASSRSGLSSMPSGSFVPPTTRSPRPTPNLPLNGNYSYSFLYCYVKGCSARGGDTIKYFYTKNIKIKYNISLYISLYILDFPIRISLRRGVLNIPNKKIYVYSCKDS